MMAIIWAMKKMARTLSSHSSFTITTSPDVEDDGFHLCTAEAVIVVRHFRSWHLANTKSDLTSRIQKWLICEIAFWAALKAPLIRRWPQSLIAMERLSDPHLLPAPPSLSLPSLPSTTSKLLIWLRPSLSSAPPCSLWTLLFLCLGHCYNICIIIVCIIIIDPDYHHYWALWRPPDIQGLALPSPALPPSLILNQPQYPNLLVHPQYPSSICNIQSMINPDIHSYSIHPSIHHTASKLNLDEKEAMICSVWLNSILYFVSASRICVFVSWPNPRACELQLLPTYCASTDDSGVHTIFHVLYFDWCFDVLSCIM